MLFIDKEIPELFDMKHRNDSFVIGSNENDILDKTLSPHIYKNDVMNAFLKRLQIMVYLFFDKMNLVRNFKNPTVDKYEYRHLD